MAAHSECNSDVTPTRLKDSHSRHSRLFWLLVSNTDVKWIHRIALTVAALLSFVVSVAASPCSSPQIKDTARPGNAERTSKAARTTKDESKPCDGTASYQSQTGQEVGWDPISCWDCPTPKEYVAFFLVGLLVCTPIFLLVRRIRTRRRDSALPHRFLEF